MYSVHLVHAAWTQSTITDMSQAPCCTSHEMEGCPHTCISQNIHISKYIQLYPGEWWLYKLYKQLILI